MRVASCPSTEELERLFLGGLSEQEAQAQEQHVLACVRCLEKLKTLVRTRDTLASMLSQDTHSDGYSSSPVVTDLVKQLKLLRPASPSGVPQGAPMISVTCTSCQKNLSVKDTLAGKKIKCPGCGQVLAVSAKVAASVAGQDLRTLPPAPAPQSSGQESRTVLPADTGNAQTKSLSSKPDTTKGVDRPVSDHDPSLTDFLAAPQADDELGRLGKYRILKILGYGGMGVVYKAEDPLLKRHVALKAMLPTLAASASAGKRFLREAQSMAAVEHDHIVRVHEVAEERGVPFLAMEFLKGEPLDVRLEREKLPVGEVVRIGKEIAEGLEAAHATGLIHRDIKPGNIWIEAPKGRVKILDFGLARSAQQESGLTQQGAIIGTPAYMAPEQARGDAVDARSDLFSLGVILYRLCCGQQAFRGKDTVSTLMAVATHEPPPPIQTNPELPPELSDLVMQLLQKDSERRPASATVVVAALQALQKKLAQQDQPSQQTVDLGEGAASRGKAAAAGKPPARRRRVGLLVGAAVLLAGLVGVGLSVSGLIRFSSEQGDLVLDSDDPDFAFVPIKGGGVTLEDRKTKRIYQVKAVPQGKGDYELEVTDAGAELVFKTKTFTVQRGGKVALKAWFERKDAAQPPDEAWIKEIAKLPAEKQVEAVVARLKERHPRFNEKDHNFWYHIEQGTVKWLNLWGQDLADLTPLRALPLKRLEIPGTKVTDLAPLKGTPLTELLAWNTPLADLAPLRGMPLTHLNVGGTKVADLAPLQGMPLISLDVAGTGVSDLSPLRGMKLQGLGCAGTRVTDLSPLKGMPLRRFDFDFDPKRDDALLRSLPTLEAINGRLARGVAPQFLVYGSKGEIPTLKTNAAEDITIETVFTHIGHNEGAIVGTEHFRLQIRGGFLAVAFASKKFSTMLLNPTMSELFLRTHLAAVKSVDGLRFYVNGKLVGKNDLAEPISLDAAEPFLLGGTGMWLHEFRVSRTARYRGDFTPPSRFTSEADTLALYHCDEGEGNVLNDASGNKHHARLEKVRWVRGLLEAPPLKPVGETWLKEVAALPADKQVEAVLARLQDRNPDFDGKVFHKITAGAVTELWLTAPTIVDIDPVRALSGLQIVRWGPAVADLSPLKGLPIKEIGCDFKPERDAAVLRSIKTLETINQKPAAQFWKEVDAKKEAAKP